MPIIAVTRLRLRDPALPDEFHTATVAVLEQAKITWQSRRGRPRRRAQRLVNIHPIHMR
jgi:hypothetical protein